MTLLSRLRIRSRLLLGVLVPVLITAATLAWITVAQIKSGGEAELERLEASLLDSRKEGLKSLVDAARSVVLEAKNDPDLSDAEAREAARDRLRSIKFEGGNYVFAYARDLENLAYAPDPSREGPTTNPDVQTLIRSLFDAAEEGGFFGYDWPNPASGNVEPKVSFSAIIPYWDWMIGTGVYVTDIDEVVAAARAEIEQEIADTLGFIVMVTVVVVIIAMLIGIFVGRTVTNPLNRVIALMKDIAEGEGDLRHRLPDEGNDELAELGRRFNAFIVKIQNTIREVGATTDQVASAAEEL
ncbi:MAG TPA: cache domain-containing protein, partial [Marinobacter sp.]